MKIREIQAFPLAYPEPHYKGIERYITLTPVESDDGLVGWASASHSSEKRLSDRKSSLSKGSHRYSSAKTG